MLPFFLSENKMSRMISRIFPGTDTGRLGFSVEQAEPMISGDAPHEATYNGNWWMSDRA